MVASHLSHKNILLLKRLLTHYWTSPLNLNMSMIFTPQRREKIYSHEFYTGWPRKNAKLTINNFKKMRDRMKTCALLHIKFFSQQDHTKIVNFDEGVLILWPFFWGNVIFKLCPSISKVTIYIPKISIVWLPWVNCQLLLCKAKPACMNNKEKHSLHNFAALESGGATQRNSSLPQTWLLIQK